MGGLDVNVVLSIDYSNQQRTIESDALKVENSHFFKCPCTESETSGLYTESKCFGIKGFPRWLF